MTALGGVSLFVRAVSPPFVRSQRREDLNKGWRAFAHGEVLTLRLIQHLRIDCVVWRTTWKKRRVLESHSWR